MASFSLFSKKESAAVAARNRARERVATSSSRNPDWNTVRGTPRDQDRAVSRHAQAWLDTLPPRARLKKTAELYPRIINRLALCWHDPLLLERVFDDMLVDHRGKRRGFPPQVTQELLSLREQVAMVDTVEERQDAWSMRMQAVSDR